MELIRQKKALTGIRNTSAYLRKMAIDGYVINLDIKQLNEISRLLRITSNNVNAPFPELMDTKTIVKMERKKGTKNGNKAKKGGCAAAI